MKKILLIVFPVLFVVTSCNKHEESIMPSSTATEDILVQKANPVPVPQKAPLSKEKIDEIVTKTMNERKDFRWEFTDLYTTWSAIYHTNEFAIGYKPATTGDITETIHNINIGSSEWKAVHDALIKLVLDLINKDNPKPLTAAEIIVEDDPVLPILIFRISDKNVITQLYNLQNIRYLEPMGYWPDTENNERSTTGCSSSTQALNSADWTTTAPGARVPWNFDLVNIPAAWDVAQGTGIKVGVIDAGISSTQQLLGNQFNDGYSNVGRTITTGYTYGSSAYTSCTHGTSMSGQAVGPRNSKNATTGVAYRSSLHFIRASQDVVLDQSAEHTGVKNALVAMGNDNSIRIISMSIGTPFYSGVIYDGVTYAYGKGKMMFAAAGTSYGWTSWYGVIYPAAHTQCIAITGVKENGSKCSSCHDGSQVEFTIPMERNVSSARNSLSLAASGYTPTYIGGSSCATATSAGIAALVWSTKPYLTREQVYICLRNTAQFYPGKSSSKGYGNLNAAAAVNMAVGM